MKQFIIILFCIFSINLISQDRLTEFKLYIPLKTYHFDRTPDLPYHNTEGGHGIVGIYRKTNKIWFNDIQVGVLANSYHKLSILTQYGVGRSIGDFDISLNMGIISGYNNLFDAHFTRNGNYKEHGVTNPLTNNLPTWIRNNGILPIITLALSYEFGKISPLIVINPAYINGGIVINI